MCTFVLTTQDELGKLAASFNAMTAVLRQARTSLQKQNQALQTEMNERKQAQIALRQSEEQYRRELEQRVAERTQELTTLLEVSHNLTLALSLSDLLQLIINKLRLVVPYSAAYIAILEDETLQYVAYQGPRSPEKKLAFKTHIGDLGMIWPQLAKSETVIVQDLDEDTPVATAYHRMASIAFAEDISGEIITRGPG